MRVAQTLVRPSALREQALELPAVRWADVGGLADIKQRLAEAVEWPQRHPDALARLGARVRARAAHSVRLEGAAVQMPDCGRAGECPVDRCSHLWPMGHRGCLWRSAGARAHSHGPCAAL